MKNLKGGYALISLALLDLTLASSGVEVSGIFEALSKTNQKRVVLTGIVVDGEKKPDVTVQVTYDEDAQQYVIKDVYGYDIYVLDDDSVEAREVQPVETGSAIYKHIVTVSSHKVIAFTNQKTAFSGNFVDAFKTKLENIISMYYVGHEDAQGNPNYLRPMIYSYDDGEFFALDAWTPEYVSVIDPTETISNDVVTKL